MSPTTSEWNARWAGWVIDELARSGITRMGVASGSRCSPLTVAAARHPGVELVQHVDERGLGYFAVGYARATGRAAAIITTSGTAVANLLPAVCEADAARLPLLVLSADRPPELRHTQANQTLHQPGIFGERVRWFKDLPCPADDLPQEYLLTTLDQAVHRTRRSPGGPVHLNLMFREPLSGAPAPPPPVRDHEGPHTTYAMASAGVVTSPASLARVQRGVLVVGELSGPDERDAVCRVASTLQWPVLADVTSGLHFGGIPDSLGITYFDLLLPRSALTARIDGVVHMGGRIVSKRLARALADTRPDTWTQVADHPERHDPDHAVRHRIDGSLGAFADGLQAPPHAPAWLAEWRALDHRVASTLDPLLQGTLSEPRIAAAVVRDLPDGHGLCLGNSMPVRDVLSFAPSVGRAVPLCVNRGVSGIDGTLSTAVGFAAGIEAPVTLLIGDLSLLHDLNALGLVRSSAHSVTVVVINNDGGGIFHFLPIADDEAMFEPWFGTPHGLRFESVAGQYGLTYHAPSTPAAFREVYTGALASGASSVIEVQTDRRENAALHQDLTEQIQDRLA